MLIPQSFVPSRASAQNKAHIRLIDLRIDTASQLDDITKTRSKHSNTAWRYCTLLWTTNLYAVNALDTNSMTERKSVKPLVASVLKMYKSGPVFYHSSLQSKYQHLDFLYYPITQDILSSVLSNMKPSLSSLMVLLGTTATIVSGKVCNIPFPRIFSVQGQSYF
jgi:hypothetical protein